MNPPADLPGWLRPLADVLTRPEAFASIGPIRSGPPDPAARASAVLVLFGDSGQADREPPGDLLLIERAHTMRRHAAQMAFPGGAVEPGDSGPIAAAVREAQEETGLDPAGVAVLGALPQLHLPNRTPVPGAGFVVTPVLAWWREPSDVYAADPAEVASVHRVPLHHLTDPAHRLRVQHPSGYVGPAFRLGHLLVWGFTAGILDRLLRVAGWEREWDSAAAEDVPAHLLGLKP